MRAADTLERGRAAFRQQAWGDAYDQLSAADREDSLNPEDLERLATAAYLVGRDEESADIWARAHHAFLSRDTPERAVRCAFWLAIGLMHRGESARGGGWIARARRLLEDIEHDCVEQGYLLMPVALRSIGQGDPEAAHATFGEAAAIGERFGDTDLVAFARHGRGRALIRMGDIAAGVALLDEAMVTIASVAVSPLVVGDVYCSVIEACHEISDYRRAQEWTAVLSDWCASQPDLVPYRGECMVRRSELMQLQGAWPDAMDEAKRACTWLTEPPGKPAAGAAFYQRAELHRLRGEFDAAEEAYREASKWGRRSQPGLAQLRLAQGKVDAAKAAICRAVDEAHDRATRSNLLPAKVEIMLAAEDVPTARVAADELTAMADDLGAQLLRAIAARAQGAVLLAEGDPQAALVELRDGWTAWEELDVPYDAARVRVLIGLACRALGDEDTATMEFDAARWTFQQLEAAPDLARVETLTETPVSDTSDELTPRQFEVLRLVAAGQTNREIADELFISEKTVARHVSDIFARLDLSNRAEATAYAYKHGLV